MGIHLALLVNIFILLLLFFGGIWIALALGIAGLIGLYLDTGIQAFSSIGLIGWNTSNDFVYTAIPLFILMGELIMHSGLSIRFYNGIAVWIRSVPGGLLHTNIISCAIFAGISGSSVATAVTIGTVAIPEMKRRGYDERLTLGSLAAGGTLGILIPPSIVMIIYGAMVEQSIVKLFMAGIIPGILLSVLFMGYIFVKTFFDPSYSSGIEKKDMPFLAKLKVTLSSWPVYLIITIVIGGLYMGIATPTEVAALGALSALIVGLIYKELKWSSFVKSLKNSISTTCMIMFIIVGAQIYSFALSHAGIPRAISGWIISFELSPTVFFIILCIFYLILGCFLDGVSMMVLTLPVLYPTIYEMGFDPIWFGVILTILIELGQITPPMGLNLFAIHGIAGGSISDVIIGSFPFCIIMCIMIVILKIFPDIVLWLPRII